MTTHKPISYHPSVSWCGVWTSRIRRRSSSTRKLTLRKRRSLLIIPCGSSSGSSRLSFIGVDCRPGRASFAGRNPYCELQDKMENIQGQERHPIDVKLLKAAREGNTQLLEQLLDEELPSRVPDHIAVSVPPTSFGSSAGGQGGHGEASTSRHRHVSLTPSVSKLLQGVTSDLDVVLHIAAKLGHVGLVRAISMREGLVVNVPAKNKRGETPLHCAAANGNVDMIDLLILMAGEVGAMQLLSERNHNGETCLHEAVRCGNTEAAKKLVMADVAVQHYRDICRGRALVQIEDDEGVSPLYLATTLCRFEIVRCLTEREQDARYSASYTGPEKKTAMHAAVLASKELSEHLMQWNACLVEKTDLFGNTPLHLLASTGDTSIAEILLKKDERAGYREDAEGSLPIHVAAANGNLDFIKLLLEYCPYCNWSCNSFGQTILHIAVQKGVYNVVRYVCSGQKFVEIFNTRDKDGNTALHLAILQGNQFIFCQLMSRNEVHLNCRNKEEHTPLGLALLRLPRGLKFMQAPQRWIMNDLVLAGAELDTRRLDHFDAYNYDRPDKEKHSEVLSKSAGLWAVCAVLILNISFAAPFNISKFYLDPSTSNIQAGFSTFIIADAFAFAFSMAATFWLSLAGLSIIDMRTRVIYLNNGSICLSSAFCSMVIVFLLGIFAVVAHVDAIITTAACVIALGGVIPLLGFTIYRHFWVLYQRLGFRTWCRTFLSRPPQQRHLHKYSQLGKNSLFVIIYTLGPLIITIIAVSLLAG